MLTTKSINLWGPCTPLTESTSTWKACHSGWGRSGRSCEGQGVTLLKRPSRQSAEEHSHYDNPTAFCVFKNAEPRSVQRRRPTPLLLGIVLGNIFYVEIKADQHTLSWLLKTARNHCHSNSSQEQHAPNASFSSFVAFSTLPCWSLARPFLSQVSSTPARIVWRSVFKVLLSFWPLGVRKRSYICTRHSLWTSTCVLLINNYHTLYIKNK